MTKTDLQHAELSKWDIIVVIFYFVAVFVFGIVSSLRNRGSVGGYFLAGRSMHWIPVGASIFASNTGSEHFIGLAGSGAAGGIAVANFELNAILIIIMLGWVFVPVYTAARVYTMPEYLEKRFGGQRIQIYLAVMALILSIFTKVAAGLYAGAMFIETAFGWDLYLSIICLLAIAAIFTICGGLTAVIWTDFIQTVIMIVGAGYLMIVGFVKVGGFELFQYEYYNAIPDKTNISNSCGVPSENSFSLLRPASDSAYPWTGMIFGITVSATWYWCTDQVIVQRALAAKTMTHAKAGSILAAYLKVLPTWLLIFPGMIARILFRNTVGCADPDVCESVCGTRSGCTNLAYPYLIVKLMPQGAAGLMVAVMMAALMSSLTSIFNSSATIFTMDIWKKIRKHTTDTELMIVGRVFVLAMVGIGIAWIPIVKGFAELFQYIQSITSYLSPPICAVYLLAVLVPRTNEKGAFTGLMCGLIIGLTRFIVEFSYKTPLCGEVDLRPSIIKDVHYLHFGAGLCVFTMFISLAVSYMSEPLPEEKLRGMTFWTRWDNEKKEEDDEIENDSPENKKKGMIGSSVSSIMTIEEMSSTANIIADSEDVLPIWKKAIFWICGIEKKNEPELTEQEKDELTASQCSLKEDPFWKHVVNVNAIIVAGATVFIYGYFH